MGLKMHFPLDNRGYIDFRLGCFAMVFTLLFGANLLLSRTFHFSRESLFPSSDHNRTYTSNLLRCKTPYDGCRCSKISNRSDESIKCLNDVEAMAGHILPLVSYALQVYVVSKIFYFTGPYSDVFTDIFWLVSLFIFVIIAIGVHGSSCLHQFTSLTIDLAELSLATFIGYLYNRSHSMIASRECHNNYRHQRTITNNHNDDRSIISTNNLS